MTTPQPYSSDFSVPPTTGTAATITEDMLPPPPPRPMTLSVGAVLLGLCGLVVLVGGVWDVIDEVAGADTSRYDTSPTRLVLSTVYPLLVCTAIAALFRLLWLGSHVGLILAMIAAGYAAFLVGVFGFTVLETLSSREPLQPVVDRYLEDPGALCFGIAAVVATPTLVLFVLPASRRWSSKAGMIRQIRGLIRKGRPLTRLPQSIFE